MVTLSGTALPFSTSGGRSNITLPGLTCDSPTTWRMAVCVSAGVAPAPSTFRIEASAAPPASRPAATRRPRRVGGVFIALIETAFSLSVAQGGQERHDILDLLGGQHRLGAKIRRNPRQTGDAVIGRHDGVGIDLAGINHPQAQLSCRPTGSTT